MQEVVFSWQNVVNGNGMAISITGMSIVFAALILVSFYIAILPKITAFFNKIIPPAHHGGHPSMPASKPASVENEEEVVAAAIAYLQQNKS